MGLEGVFFTALFQKQLFYHVDISHCPLIFLGFYALLVSLLVRKVSSSLLKSSPGRMPLSHLKRLMHFSVLPGALKRSNQTHKSRGNVSLCSKMSSEYHLAKRSEEERKEKLVCPVIFTAQSPTPGYIVQRW